jgi:hypothetical protein
MTAALFADLYTITGSTATLQPGPAGGFGVLVDDDVIGFGETESEALEDAIATARGWSK